MMWNSYREQEWLGNDTNSGKEIQKAFTSISVKHGYIQVSCSSVDDILFQILTSQKIFSNMERAEKWLHTHTHRTLAQADTY